MGELETFNGGAVLTADFAVGVGDDLEIGLALALTAGTGIGLTADLAEGLAADSAVGLTTGFATALGAGLAGALAGFTLGLATGLCVTLGDAFTTALDLLLDAGAVFLPATGFFATAFLTGILLNEISSKRWLYPYGLWRRLRRTVFARRGL